MATEIKILLVDDHYIVRQGIKSLLTSACDDFTVVADVSNGEEALSLLRSKKIVADIVLMDMNMPGIGGLEASMKIMHYCPKIKIIGLSAFVEDPIPSKLLQAGARGYLTKESGIEQMVQAIKLVNSGQRYISPDVAQQLVLKNMSDNSENPFEQLSKREFQIALMIAKGMDNKNISNNLNLSPKTISTYRNRIFTKLFIKNDVELSHHAIRHGLLSMEHISNYDEKSNI